MSAAGDFFLFKSPVVACSDTSNFQFTYRHQEQRHMQNFRKLHLKIIFLWKMRRKLNNMVFPCSGFEKPSCCERQKKIRIDIRELNVLDSKIRYFHKKRSLLAPQAKFLKVTTKNRVFIRILQSRT